MKPDWQNRQGRGWVMEDDYEPSRWPDIFVTTVLVLAMTAFFWAPILWAYIGSLLT